MRKVYPDAKAALAGLFKDGMTIWPAALASAAFQRP